MYGNKSYALMSRDTKDIDLSQVRILPPIPEEEKPKKKTGFQPGHKLSHGRPVGSKNRVTILKEAIKNDSEEVILKHFPKIVDAVCKKAEKGDLRAAKLLFDRILPAKKVVDDRDEDQFQGLRSLEITINTTHGHTKVHTVDEPIENVEYEEINADLSDETKD